MDLPPIFRRRPSRNKAALRKTVDQSSRAVRLEKQKSGDITNFNRPRVALGLYDQKRLVLMRRQTNRLGALFRKRQILPDRYPKSRQGSGNLPGSKCLTKCLYPQNLAPNTLRKWSQFQSRQLRSKTDQPSRPAEGDQEHRHPEGV